MGDKEQIIRGLKTSMEACEKECQAYRRKSDTL